MKEDCKKVCLDLDVLGIIRTDFPELAAVTAEQCCEHIQRCKDTKKYLELREKVDKNDDSSYLNLADQIINLCSHGIELKAGTLSCGLRKYQKQGD